MEAEDSPPGVSSATSDTALVFQASSQASGDGSNKPKKKKKVKKSKPEVDPSESKLSKPVTTEPTTASPATKPEKKKSKSNDDFAKQSMSTSESLLPLNGSSTNGLQDGENQVKKTKKSVEEKSQNSRSIDAADMSPAPVIADVPKTLEEPLEEATGENPSVSTANGAAASSTSFAPVRWWPTFQALTRKNVLLIAAARWQLLIIVLLPLLSMSLTYTMQRVAENLVEKDQQDDSAQYDAASQLQALTTPATQVVQQCEWFDVYGVKATDECATILFAPLSSDDWFSANSIMQYVAAEAGLPFVPITNDGGTDKPWLAPSTWTGGTVLGVPSVQDMGEFIVSHPGRAQSIVYFASDLSRNGAAATDSNFTAGPPLIHFRFNNTRVNGPEARTNRALIPMALQRAMMALYDDKEEINIRIYKRNMFIDPTDADRLQQGQSTISQEEQDALEQEEKEEEENKREVTVEVVSFLFGPIFLFGIAMSAAMLSTHASAEKSNGLIGSLRVAGMADSAYWMSWWFVGTFVVIVPSCLLTMAFAHILGVALVSDVSFLAILIALTVQYSSIFALNLFAVALATNRPFLYALFFVVLCLGVTSVSLASTFLAGPTDKVGKIFQILVPGFNLGGILDTMYRYNTRAGFSEEALGNFSQYDFAMLFSSFGQCNQTLLESDNVCEEIELFDDGSEACWIYTDCRGLDPEDIFDEKYCAPQSCFFYPLSGIARIGIMCVQTFVLMFLAWYVLQVIPSSNGLTYPPWFVFDPRYWMGSKTSVGENNDATTDQQRSRQESSIVLRGLTKMFNNHTAVDHLDMDIKNGQVFVLLGHNGSGKTTTLNMLTGKLSPSSGEAYVMGLSVKDSVHGIQRLVGSVPQHDLLWGELSATEHIRMFAQIKGVRRSQLGEEVDRVLRKVHLVDAAKQAAGGYSGGMKRRLSIALAGIGGPRIIMLDEPTTGIDPLNRRRIWNLVRDLKRDRIIVLTTHLMQEADSLGDHIAILDNGKIQAQGTPLNLKTEHGAGYSLSIVTEAQHVDRVKTLARELMPTIELVNEAAGSLAFGVHSDELAAIPTLTRQLQGEGKLREWNISQSTMEEVFLRLASNSSALQARRHEMNVTSTGQTNSATQGRVGESETVEPSLLEVDEAGDFVEGEDDVFAPSSVHWRLQLFALLRKTFLLKRRHWIGTLLQLAIPIALIALAKKFLFKDLSVQQWETLVWPQATTDNWYNYGSNRGNNIGDSQCSFAWKLWSLTYEDDDDVLDVLKNGRRAADSIEFPDSRGNQINALSFRVSNLSGQSEDDVRAAMIEAMQFFLSRSSTEATQNAADAACSDSVCGPCSLDPDALQLHGQNSDQFDFRIDGALDDGFMPRCDTYVRPCSLDAYRIMLTNDDVMAVASQMLNVDSLEIGQIEFHAEPGASGYSSLFQTPSVEVYHDNYSNGRSCGVCRQVPHVWLSGPNADLFDRSLSEIGLDLTSEIKQTDIIASIVQNRRVLTENATTFSDDTNLDTSACAKIGKDFYSDYLANDQGFISNLDNVQPFPFDNNTFFDSPSGFDDFSFGEPACNASLQPLAYYRQFFPDAGITLSSFSVSDSLITLEIVWELDIDNAYYRSYNSDNGRYLPSEQSVYALYCEPDSVDEEGKCASGSSLICARAVPLSGCSGYSSYVSDSDIVDTTYKALWASFGVTGGGPLFERLNEEVPVSYEAAVSLNELALFVFMIAVAIALHAPNTASILVFEKNQRFVFAMLLNGLKFSMYWVAQYLAHLLTTGCLGALTILLGVILQLKPFSSQEPNYALLFIVLFGGIHSQFGFVVMMSSFFKKERFGAVLVGFTVLTMLGSAMLVHLASSDSLKNRWPPALSLIPTFGFFRCLLLVFWKRYYSELWAHFGVMLGSSTCYLILGIYWQSTTGVGALYQRDCGICSKIIGTGAPGMQDADDADDVADADIAREENRAMRLSPEETAIKIQHLGKTFPARPNPKHAVVDVTMAMDYGEIFGLLGPNGAGKTTVISMLVGQLTPSRGSAFVAGYDTVEERRLALSKIGIVPQFDVYYPELTVREHLMLYAAMKGVRRSEQNAWAQSIASTVGLGADDLFHRQARALSGGMRRRLSIAVALLSRPSCLFLDEPTTGLDPEMKRSIWTIVERMRKDRCVILTTHAMDEAEALCSRIGIMAQGSLQCIGTQKELRERYGSTYELTFTLPKGTPKSDDRLLQYLSKYCPSTASVSSFGDTRVFTVNKSDMELTDLFETIVQGRNQKLYTQWAIANTSLDEVFIAITAESEGVDAGEL